MTTSKLPKVKNDLGKKVHLSPLYHLDGCHTPGGVGDYEQDVL